MHQYVQKLPQWIICSDWCEMLIKDICFQNGKIWIKKGLPFIVAGSVQQCFRLLSSGSTPMVGHNGTYRATITIMQSFRQLGFFWQSSLIIIGLLSGWLSKKFCISYAVIFHDWKKEWTHCLLVKIDIQSKLVRGQFCHICRDPHNFFFLRPTNLSQHSNQNSSDST